MISFNKKNEQLADVLLDGVKIGHIEFNPFEKMLTLEISYLRVDLSYSKKKMVGTLAKRIYTRLEELKKPKAKLPVSMLVTGNYEILD